MRFQWFTEKACQIDITCVHILVMNAQVDIENAKAQGEDYDQVLLFNALGLSVEEQDRLLSSWESVAPNASLNDYVRTMVMGGAKLAQDMR